MSIDDFGTGYSSLAYLQNLPIDQIKVDRSFVMNLASVPGDAVIVRSTIDLAHNLGLTVVAEGVEDEITLDMLVEYGCDSAQGLPLQPRARGRGTHRMADRVAVRIACRSPRGRARKVRRRNELMAVVGETGDAMRRAER